MEAYVLTHQDEWRRLESLLSHRRRLNGAEIDELVDLYQRATTHLSVVRSNVPDTILIGRLSSLVARARSAVTGVHTPASRDFARFFQVVLPAALYRSSRWWVGVGLAFTAIGTAIGAWVAASPSVQAAVGSPAQIRQLVERDFANYYSENPASEFAFGVWTNNALIAAACLVLGVLVVPVALMLWVNAENVAVSGGLMAAHDKLDVFFGLITPHGLLELTAVFVAAGAGLRLGWTVIHPGRRTRATALAETGRTTVGIALGLVLVLAISGVIEGFVTPSPLPTWARIGIGVVAEAAFLAYVFVLGRRAARAGETGDIAEAFRPDALPTSG